jgi:CHAT domain-containing protein
MLPLLAAVAYLTYAVLPNGAMLTVTRGPTVKHFALGGGASAVARNDALLRDRLQALDAVVGGGCGGPDRLSCAAMERYANNDIPAFAREGSSVYQWIVPRGARELLRGVAIVHVRRPDALADVPFEALVTDASPSTPRYFVDSHAVVYDVQNDAHAEPAAGLTAWPRAFVAFANPDFSGTDGYPPLPGGAQAATNSAKELAGRSDLHLGDEASTQTVQQLNASGVLREYEYLFISTHSAPHDGQSALLFSPSSASRYFSAADVARLSLSAHLVVVSACASGAIASSAASGSLGLTGAFFHAGAHAVIVTRWAVLDTMEAVFVPDIFASIAKGSTTAQSLQHAELDLIEGPEKYLHHPYFWASMVLEQ